MFRKLKNIYVIILLFTIASSLYAQKQKNIDSLLSLLNNEKEIDKIPILFELSTYYQDSLPKKSIVFLNKALEISQEKNLKEKEILTINKLATLYQNINEYSQAIEYYRIAVDYYQNSNNNIELANCLSNLGIIYTNLGDFDKSVSYLLKALKIAEKAEYFKGVARNYGNLAIIYSKFKKYELAIDYFYKADSISFIIGDTNGVALSKINIGNIYGNLKKYEKAIHNYNAALKIFKNRKDKHGSALAYANIGVIYINLEKYDNAIISLNHALDIFEELGEYKFIADCYYNISKVYFETDNTILAKEFMTKSTNISKKNKIHFNFSDHYELLSEILKKEKNYKKSLEYYKLFKQYNDSIFNENRDKRISELQIKYDTENNLQEIEYLKNENKYRNKLNIYLIISIIFVLLLAIASILIYFLRAKNSKQKLIISNEKKEKQKIENEKLRIEIKAKYRELTSKTMQLMQNAEQNDKFIIDLKPMRKFISPDGKKQFLNLIRSYKININKKNWEEFELYFEKVHKDFYNKLNLLPVSLTVNEKKLCAFLYLQMSSKDIALITSRTTDSVHTARKRLRKKLNMPTKISFQEFFTNL